MSEMQKRKFSSAQKMAILAEAEKTGVKVTLEKHGIYPATYYNWREKFRTMGEPGFGHGMTVAHLKEIKRLEKENAKLKQILAEKELEHRLKDELLKKMYPLSKKRTS